MVRKAKEIVDSGRIGEVFRVQLICSNWFRGQVYYDAGSWRGTWSGEGGGILTNQAPHHLDMFQWIGGVPKRILAVLSTRAHRIEVEDTANVILEYDRGKVGYIYATTAEEPGQEQLLICGEKGTLILEDRTIRLGKLRTSIRHHIDTAKAPFEPPQKVTWSEVKYRKARACHGEVARRFARHIRNGTPMVCTGAQGIWQVELTNAAYLSGFTGRPVELPVNADQMEKLLTKLQRQHPRSRGGKMRQEADRELRKLLRK
jgi:predicted dehydrogenase